MNLWDKITGNDMTREFKDFEVRVKKLPYDYQEVWEKINGNILIYGNFTGRNLMPILNNVLDMLEENVAEGLTVKETLGDDIEGFCAELAGEEGTDCFRDKWRKQLNNKIAKKLGK